MYARVIFSSLDIIIHTLYRQTLMQCLQRREELAGGGGLVS